MALLRFTPLLLLLACAPKVDNSDVYEVINNSKHAELQALTKGEIDNRMKLMPPLYDIDDLLGLVSEFGQVEVDYVPAWNNFFQDASCNTAKWDYFGAPCDSVQWFIYDEVITSDTLKFQTYFPSGMPRCEGYEPPCNGAHFHTVRAYLNGAIYERSAVGWANVLVPLTLTCTEYAVWDVTPSGIFEAGQPLVFEPYEFMIQGALQYDLNGDYIVNINDLWILLSAYA